MLTAIDQKPQKSLFGITLTFRRCDGGYHLFRIFAVFDLSPLTLCINCTVFTARRYASAVLGVVILSFCLSVCQTRAL